MNAPQVPEQIRKVFGLGSGECVPEPGFTSRWRLGEVVCSRVDDAPLATASARARERLELEGIIVARPLRGSDGRYVVGGWRADRYPAAMAEQRPDEIVALAGRLPAQLGNANANRRRHRGSSTWGPAEIFDRAFTAAWEGDPARDLETGLERNMGRGASGFQAHRAEALVAAKGMTRLRDSVRAATESAPRTAPELMHLDMVRSLRFNDAGPILTDVLLTQAPTVRGQALAAVDLLAAGAAAGDLLWRWESLPNWGEHVACAVAYRLGVHALHPSAATESYAGLRAAAMAVEHFIHAAYGV